MPDGQQTLAQRVRAKYPGSYDDMDDSTLERAVLARHPEYSDLPRTPFGPANAPNAPIPDRGIPGAPSGLPGVPGAATPQPNNLSTILTGAPLTGMEAGLQSPAQDPQTAQGMQLGAAAGSAIANPIAAAGAVAGGYTVGKGARYGAKKAGLGETGQNVAETGGNIVGGLAGGMGGGLLTDAGKALASKLVYKPTGELTAWAEALVHPSKLPETALRNIIPEPAKYPGAPMPSVDEFYEQKAKDLMARGRQQQVLDKASAREAANAPQPLFPGATSTAGTLPQTAQLPPVPQGSPTPFSPVQKFTPPEQSRIVTPGSQPPNLPVTYQSYPREQLYEMAKRGDVQAGLELIRSPKGFKLPPNFKFLIEETAQKTPWRNYAK